MLFLLKLKSKNFLNLKNQKSQKFQYEVQRLKQYKYKHLLYRKTKQEDI